ncbi:DUF2690 domain-containing protein [Kitasatospora sp. HPMI-4]|uniref:DUF2690 domain-containing protein n=1 Tax=Kitasatospora sp. HPMI-4 TaxID=3448443 RepID=UPI003F1C5FDD
MLLALGSLAAAPSASHAAPTAGCYAESCHDQDPIEQHCDSDAQSVASYSIADTVVELIWSNSCHANWAFARATPNLAGIYVAADAEYESQRNDLGTNFIFTKMVDGDPVATACGWTQDGGEGCTPPI